MVNKQNEYSHLQLRKQISYSRFKKKSVDYN